MSRGLRPSRARAVPLLIPAALVLGLLFVGPQALLFDVSLGRRGEHGGVARDDRSADNYARAAEPLYLGIAARSVALAAATTAACLVLGLPMAFWLARVAPPRWRPALVALVVLPFWTSFLVRMYAWMFLLRSEGPVTALLAALGFPAAGILYTDAAVLLGQVYGELPFMVLPLYAALERLDPALLDAAADLGARPWAAFRRVILPLVAPGIAAGCALVFIPSLGAYLAPDLLGGARTAYLGNLVQSQFAVARDAPFGAALSFLLTALVLLLLFVLRRPLAEAHRLERPA